MTPESAPHWPIFVLSLRDADERRAALLASLAQRGLTPTVFDAIDGRRGLPPEHSDEIDRTATLETFGRAMSDAEYACALSHLAIYRTLIERDLPGAIVFEDDAILTPLFDAFLEAEGYLAGDLVQMDHMDADIWRGDSLRHLTPEIALARAARTASLASAYAISAKGARYFLDTAFPVRAPADWPSDPTVIGGLLCLPCVVNHPPFDKRSTLETERAELRRGQRSGNRAARFFTRAYWTRWWFKRRTKRVS